MTYEFMLWAYHELIRIYPGQWFDWESFDDEWIPYGPDTDFFKMLTMGSEVQHAAT